MLAGGLITTIQSSVLLVLSPASPPHVILPASPCKVEEMFDDYIMKGNQVLTAVARGDTEAFPSSKMDLLFL